MESGIWILVLFLRSWLTLGKWLPLSESIPFSQLCPSQSCCEDSIWREFYEVLFERMKSEVNEKKGLPHLSQWPAHSYSVKLNQTKPWLPSWFKLKRNSLSNSIKERRGTDSTRSLLVVVMVFLQPALRFAKAYSSTGKYCPRPILILASILTSLSILFNCMRCWHKQDFCLLLVSRNWKIRPLKPIPWPFDLWKVGYSQFGEKALMGKVSFGYRWGGMGRNDKNRYSVIVTWTHHIHVLV